MTNNKANYTRHCIKCGNEFTTYKPYGVFCRSCHHNKVLFDSLEERAFLKSKGELKNER